MNPSRLSTAVFVPLLVALLLGSNSPMEYNDKTTCDGLTGTWTAVALTHNGFEMPEGMYRGRTITFTADQVTQFFPPKVVTTAPYRADLRLRPGHFGELNTGGVKQIYQMEGDTLRIAHRQSGKDERPKGFDDTPNDLVICTYKRVK